MQIMKSMVRAHGNIEAQLRLAHDFRAAALGTPRVVRRLLANYHLPEMPEEWNQLAFDDHVYDMNTQGRKTPTHLIMDAWIKGMRTITVLYDNCVEMEAADEIVKAADIVGITVRVGLEFQASFYGRFVDMLWVPRGFSSGRDFIEFLQSPQMAGLCEMGREVLHWRRDMALLALEAWNDSQRPALAERWGVNVAPASLEAFLDYMGRGHASLRRLAEYLQLPCAAGHAGSHGKNPPAGRSRRSRSRRRTGGTDLVRLQRNSGALAVAEGTPRAARILSIPRPTPTTCRSCCARVPAISCASWIAFRPATA